MFDQKKKIFTWKGSFLFFYLSIGQTLQIVAVQAISKYKEN